MADVHNTSLTDHAAAREVKEDNAALSAGQAMATADVPAHAITAAIYAATAARDAPAFLIPIVPRPENVNGNTSTRVRLREPATSQGSVK